MKRTIFLSVMSFALVCLAGHEFMQPVAHSVSDWDSYPGGGRPEQGYRQWFFGYYEKSDLPSSFRRFPSGTKNYWGDGSFTYGSISSRRMTWSTHAKKYSVVRRWVASTGGTYEVELRGSHHLSVKGKSVSWPRKLSVFHNQSKLGTFSFPGLTQRTHHLPVTLAAGDRLDFACEPWGGSLELTIVLRRAGSGLTVISGGRSDYAIVIPRHDPGGISRLAAELLQRVVCESTTVSLPIHDDSAQISQPAIYVGQTKRTQALGLVPSDMREHEFIRRVVGGDLFIFGVNSLTEGGGKKVWRRGDIKAVCSFLEDQVGARFLLPSHWGEEIPSLGRLTIPGDLNLRSCPPFPYHVTSHWILINRGEWDPYIVAANFMDRRDMRYFYGHSHVQAVPARKWGKTHPEYFALQGGKRCPEKIGNQLCLSNPFVRHRILESMEESFRDGWRWYQLCQSDAFFACECPACQKLGSPSRRVWDLHLWAASEVYKKYPDCKVHILAYEVSQEPPSWVERFPPNVIIELSKYDEDEFRKWDRFHVPHMVYDYNWGTYHELGYFPKRTPSRLADQLRRFQRHGVLSIFNCGFATSTMGLEAPATYAYGKLLGDLSLNPLLLVEDYCLSSYGKEAGPLMYSFFTTMYKHLESLPENAYFTTGDHRLVRTPDSMITHHFPAGSLVLMERQLTRAEQLVKTPKQRMRLLSVRLHFDYVRSVVKALSAFHAYQLMPTRGLFELICASLREREEAIDRMLSSEIPASWKGSRDRAHWLAGGSLSGVLGAPFTWDYKTMEKSGRLPLLQNKDALATRLSAVPTLDSAIWGSLPTYVLEKVSGGSADIPSSFQVGYDECFLYFRFQATTPFIGSKNYVSTGREHYIGTECFDVFLNPTGLSDRYFQFIFSPAPDSYLDGNMNIGKFGADPSLHQLDRSWNGGWTYEYRIVPERDQWVALLKVPVSSLAGFKPGAGKSLTMNVGRICGSKLYLWSPNSESQRFGNTSAFGTLEFR